MKASLKWLSAVSLAALLSACAPSVGGSGAAPSSSSGTAGARYDALVGKKAPLIVVTDAKGAVLHRFAALLDDVQVVEGLALYDSALAPGFGVLTTLRGDRVLYLHDPANALSGGDEAPGYEALVCLTTRTAETGVYEGQAYDIAREDRDAVLAIASGINTDQEGAEAALAGGLSEESALLGKCVIDVDDLSE